MENEKQNKQRVKKLLNIELIIGWVGCLILCSIIGIVAYVQMVDWLRIVLLAIGFLILLIMCIIALRLEQVAGFYKCDKCQHKYIPKYVQVLMAMHIGRTRYMKCPKCEKYSWNKKVLSGENDKND